MQLSSLVDRVAVKSSRAVERQRPLVAVMTKTTVTMLNYCNHPYSAIFFLLFSLLARRGISFRKTFFA